MERDAELIVTAFERVEAERLRRVARAPLGRAVSWVKRVQHRRLELTHAALLADPGWGEGGRFFLDHLYGDRDDRQRDSQFLRVIPSMVRVLPADGVRALLRLAQLHEMSERLDGRMGDALLAGMDKDPARAYLASWRTSSSRAERLQQVEAMREVGMALAAVVHLPLLSGALRVMKGPARVAGLGELHTFLADGLRCFRSIVPVGAFIEDIAAREAALIDTLFLSTPDCPRVIAQATASIGEVPW
jgi:hypothetical protein